MIKKLKELWVKYEEIIAYLIVGVLTTIVSWAAKFLANFLLYACLCAAALETSQCAVKRFALFDDDISHYQISPPPYHCWGIFKQ